MKMHRMTWTEKQELIERMLAAGCEQEEIDNLSVDDWYLAEMQYPKYDLRPVRSNGYA